MLFFQRRRLKYRDILVLKCRQLSLSPLSRLSEFCEPALHRTEKCSFLVEKKSKKVKMKTHFRDETLNSRDRTQHSASLDHSKPFSQGTVRLDFKNTKFFWEELKWYFKIIKFWTSVFSFISVPWFQSLRRTPPEDSGAPNWLAGHVWKVLLLFFFQSVFFQKQKSNKTEQ